MLYLMKEFSLCHKQLYAFDSFEGFPPTRIEDKKLNWGSDRHVQGGFWSAPLDDFINIIIASIFQTIIIIIIIIITISNNRIITFVNEIF